MKQSILDGLVESIRRYTDEHTGPSPYLTTIPGLAILHSDRVRQPNYLIFKPALCIVVQGAKWAIFGDKRLDYRAGQALVVSLEMPALGTVSEASPNEPFLGMILELDLGLMREVLDQLEALPSPVSDLRRCAFVTDLDFDGPLADCALRMVRLLDTPQAISILYPAIMREICYWLLTGPHGG